MKVACGNQQWLIGQAVSLQVRLGTACTFCVLMPAKAGVSWQLGCPGTSRGWERSEDSRDGSGTRCLNFSSCLAVVADRSDA